MTVVWPADVTEIEPPQLQVHRLSLVRAGVPPTVTFAEPGVQGAAMTGMQGWGVRTPEAAEVADATCGLDRDEHIPNAAMVDIGVISVIFATSWPPAWVGAPAGATVSAAGDAPKVQVIWAVLTTSSGMLDLRAPRRGRRLTPAVWHGTAFPNGHIGRPIDRPSREPTASAFGIRGPGYASRAWSSGRRSMVSMSNGVRKIMIGCSKPMSR